MSNSERRLARSTGSAPDALRPSEYTAALISTLKHRSARVRGADVLEIGCGSGVVLAAAGTLGAASLCGVDIEPDAIAASSGLMQGLGLGGLCELRQGDMWAPLQQRRFDLILANLPHFPMLQAVGGDRLPSWSYGGADGRALLDPFLAGVGRHLRRDGEAILAHNAFIDLERSRRMAAAQGLAFEVLASSMIAIPAAKLAVMTTAILAAETGRTIHRYGPYAFAEMHIVILRQAGDSA